MYAVDTDGRLWFINMKNGEWERADNPQEPEEEKVDYGSMRGFEMSFAYERAADAIKNECVRHDHADALEDGWFDLDSADEPLEDEVAYLESRRLLQRHPEYPEWVTICDEGEPLPEVAA